MSRYGWSLHNAKVEMGLYIRGYIIHTQARLKTHSCKIEKAVALTMALRMIITRNQSVKRLALNDNIQYSSNDLAS